MLDNSHSRLPDDFDLIILTEGNDPYLVYDLGEDQEIAGVTVEGEIQ